MQAHFQKFTFRLAKIVSFYPKKIIYPLLLPSHNCIIITMFSFQGTSLSFKRNSLKSPVWETSISSFSELVEISGIEPLTSCLQGRRSPSWAKPPYRRNQIHNLRIDLIQAQCSTVALLLLSPSNPLRWALPGSPLCVRSWWAKMDSNHRPHDYQSCALASWAIGPFLLLNFFLGTSNAVPSKLNNVKRFYTLYWP